MAEDARLPTRPPLHSDAAEDGGVPPVVTCIVCGRADCAGCARSEPRAGSALAWDGPGRWHRRLWNTTHAASTTPEQVFGELADGSMISALNYAFLCECLAVLSTFATLLITAWIVAPAFTMSLLRDAQIRSLVSSGAITLILLLVVMHALWGICIELGSSATGERALWRRGVRFGLFACGWDLVTSPAGIAAGLFSLGPAATRRLLLTALRVPRTAMRAYMRQNRHFLPLAERRANRLSFTVLGGVVFAFAVALFVAALVVAGVGAT